MSRRPGFIRSWLIVLGLSASVMTSGGCSVGDAVSDGVFNGIAGIVMEVILSAADVANIIDRPT